MKYHLFIDESGDPSLNTANADFPVFVLLGCLLKNDDYIETCKKISSLKKEFFGSEHVILHSRDIRKCEGVFAKLFDLELKEKFYQELNKILLESQYTVISVAIKKNEFIAKYGKLADDPYQLSLSFLLERVIMETDKGMNSIVEVMIESRGRKEDGILQSRYNELLDRGTQNITPERFKVRLDRMSFRKKRENDCGLQMADLCAYPVARHILNPNEPYPAYNIVEQKLRTNGAGKHDGYGLKIFP